LRTIEPTVHNQRILVKGYHAGSNAGGGGFYADLHDKSSIDNGDVIVVTKNGTRWKRLEYFYDKQRSFANSIGKRRILHNLPIEFADYNEVLVKIGNSDGWMYPQGFTIANNVVYIYY
ncbi:hypothetical protein, partial [Actinobacillus pleuropneumoniae]